MEEIIAWTWFICIASLVLNIILASSYFYVAGRAKELEKFRERTS